MGISCSFLASNCKLVRACLVAVLIVGTSGGIAREKRGVLGFSGLAGATGGSPGMPDTPEVYMANVRKAAEKGKENLAYIESLLALGMHYNRTEGFSKATKTLNEALKIIDSGVLKPTPKKDRVPDTIVEHRGNGTVSAEVVHKPLPYEETLQQLLPQLATAEIGANQLTAAEIHLKRLIELSSSNPATDKSALMSAYSNYAALLRKVHRDKEAQVYKQRADKLNSSFIPL